MGDGLMATTRPKSRPKPRRRPIASDFDEPFRAPTKAERKRLDEEQSRPYREAYEAGRKDAPSAKKKSAGGRRAGATRRRPPGARSAKVAARQLQAPVRAQVTSGLRAVGLMLAIVALYNVLTPPGPQGISGVLGGLSRGLTWLSSPTPVPKRS